MDTNKSGSPAVAEVRPADKSAYRTAVAGTVVIDEKGRVVRVRCAPEAQGLLRFRAGRSE